MMNTSKLQKAAIFVLVSASLFSWGCRGNDTAASGPRDISAQDMRQLKQAVGDGTASPGESLLLARLQVVRGAFADALSTLDTLSVPATSAAEATRQILRGLALEGQVDHAAAYVAYDLALDAFPDYPPALLRKADRAFRMGDLDDALQLLARYRAAGGSYNPEESFLTYAAAAETDRAVREDALIHLIANDTRDGYWSAKALRAR